MKTVLSCFFYLVSSYAVFGQSNFPLPYFPTTNGVVLAFALRGDILYIGGNFTEVNGELRSRLAAINVNTGAILDWNPEVNGPVMALLATDDGLLVGGNFTIISQRVTSNFARVDYERGNASLLSWMTDGEVHCLQFNRTKSIVYIGGNFNKIGDSLRTSLAAFDLKTQLLLPWRVNINNAVYALAEGDSGIFIGGRFNVINGQLRPYLARVKFPSGGVDEFTPEPNFEVKSLLISGSRLFVGGSFIKMGSISRNFFACFNQQTGELLAMNPVFDRPINALSLYRNVLLVGGEFSFVSNLPRRQVAALDTITGIPTAWRPSIGGDPVQAILGNFPFVFLGGAFNTVANESRYGLTAFGRLACTLSAKITTDSVTCFGGNDGKMNVEAINGTPPYSYFWSNHSTTITNANLGAGHYTVTVTDNNGCTATQSRQLHSPFMLRLSSTIIPDSDNSGIGSLLVQVEGGRAPYSILWHNHSLNGFNLTKLNSGFYTLTLTDARGCTLSQQFFIPNSPCNLVVKSRISDESCKGANNGKIQLFDFRGNFGKPQLVWHDGNTDSIRSNLSAGQYTVTWTDAKRPCHTEEKFTVKTQSDFLPIFLVHRPCGKNANGSIEIENWPVNQAIKLKWENGDTLPTLRNLVAGRYKLTFTLGGVCRKDTFVRVESIPLPNLQIKTYCPTLIVSDSADWYQWYRNGQPIAGANQSWYTPFSDTALFFVESNFNGCLIRSNATNCAFTDVSSLVNQDYFRLSLVGRSLTVRSILPIDLMVITNNLGQVIESINGMINSPFIYYFNSTGIFYVKFFISNSVFTKKFLVYE